MPPRAGCQPPEAWACAPTGSHPVSRADMRLHPCPRRAGVPCPALPTCASHLKGLSVQRGERGGAANKTGRPARLPATNSAPHSSPPSLLRRLNRKFCQSGRRACLLGAGATRSASPLQDVRCTLPLQGQGPETSILKAASRTVQAEGQRLLCAAACVFTLAGPGARRRRRLPTACCSRRKCMRLLCVLAVPRG